MNRTGVVLQARMGSSRLPGKVMMDLCGKPVIQRVLDRVYLLTGIQKTIVALPATPDNRPLMDYLWSIGQVYYSIPDMDNVLNRYYQVAKITGLDNIVRVTADCPLLDPEVGSQVIDFFHKGKYDYACNTQPPTYPDGFDTEIFSFWALHKTHKYTTTAYDREHVTPYMYRRPSPFKIMCLESGKPELANNRWTLDTADDLEWIRYVYRELGDNPKTEDILKLPIQHTLQRIF